MKKKILNNDFKLISTQKDFRKALTKKEVINYIKKEFNSCINNNTLNVNMICSVIPPEIRFEFTEK